MVYCPACGQEVYGIFCHCDDCIEAQERQEKDDENR